VRTLGHGDALALLAGPRERPNWLNETASMRHVRNLTALTVEFAGGRGWVTYHASLVQITRVNVGVEAGNAADVAALLLGVLHQRHPRQDAVVENLPAEDPCWPGFEQAGYFETFRRQELVKQM
jgi:hypothetical protein